MSNLSPSHPFQGNLSLFVPLGFILFLQTRRWGPQLTFSTSVFPPVSVKFLLTGQYSFCGTSICSLSILCMETKVPHLQPFFFWVVWFMCCPIHWACCGQGPNHLRNCKGDRNSCLCEHSPTASASPRRTTVSKCICIFDGNFSRMKAGITCDGMKTLVVRAQHWKLYH